MKKRALAFLMAFIMLFSNVPAQAFALTTDENGSEIYEVGDSLWLEEGVSPDAAVVSGAEWVMSETTKAESKLNCAQTEHAHSTECESVLYLCGLEAAEGHAHSESCSGLALTCGMEEIEAHAHGEGCYTEEVLTCVLEETEGHSHGETCYTQLICELEESEGHAHTEECGVETSITCGIEEHAHGEECYTDVNLVLWEVKEILISLTDVSEEELEAQAETLGTVTVTVPSSGYYTLYNPTTKWYQTVSASGSNRSYTATFTDVPEGTYIVASGRAGNSRPGGNDASVYLDSVTVSGDTAYTMTTRTSSFASASVDQQTAVAMSIYAKSSTFNHVDIRVAGEFTVDGTEHSIDLQNTSIVVVDPGKDDITGSFAENEDEDYEWRTEGTSVSKNAVIHVEFDLYIDEKLVQEGYTVEFSGFWDFVEAIRICDGIEGLDFRIVEAIVNQRYNVTYTWTGLPEGLATLPAGTTGLLAGEGYTVNTTYPKDLEIYDTANGTKYTFHGWYQWTDEANNVTVLDPAAPGEITMPASDIVIYGLWTSEPMEKADGEITLTKTFSGLPEGALPSNFFIRVAYTVDGVAHTVDVDMSQMTETDGVYSYTFPVSVEGEYTITEMNYVYAGYSNTAGVTTKLTGETASTVKETAADGTSMTLTVALPAVIEKEEAVDIGSVDFTNSYAVLTGAADILADLYIRKFDSDGASKVLAGVEFTLYADAELTEVIGTYTTNEFGRIHIASLQEGTYYLQETKALENYHADDTVYTVVVAEDAAQGYTEYNAATDTFITYTVYDVTVLVGEEVYENFSAADNRMPIYNDRIQGSIALAKDFIIVDDEGNAVASDVEAELLAGLTIRAHIHGPVVMTTEEGVATVSDWGTEYVVELKDGQWVYSQDNLELGTYLVHEVYVHMNGYDWTGATYGYNTVTVQLDEETTGEYAVVELTAENALVGMSMEIVNNYVPWTNADFIIHKVDAAGSHLAGATFQLYYDADCTQVVDASEGVTVTATTGTDGYAMFSGFTGDAIYYLKEIAAPTGYVLDGTVYTVVAYQENGTNQVKLLDAAGNQVDVNDTFEWVNNPITGDLTIKKTFSGDLTQLPVINITVTGPNGYVKYLELNGIADSEGETSAWTAVLEDLVYGEYTISEASAAVPGYDWTVTGNDVTVDIATNGQVSELTINNHYKKNEETIHNPASFFIYKADASTHEPLAGAEFTLYADDACTIPVKAEDVPEGFTIQATTDASGQAVFTGLWINTTDATATRTYWLKETKAPDGYHLNEGAVWKVVIKEKDQTVTVQVNLEKNWFENIYDWVIDQFTGTVNGSSYSAGVLTVHNEKVLGEISLSKTFAGVADADLANAEIIAHVHGPYTLSELDAIKSGDMKIGDVTDANRLILNAANGFQASKDGLVVGYYLVHEAYVHIHGYDFAKAEYDSTNKITVGGVEYVVHEVKDNAADLAVVMTNTYTEWAATDILIHKVDENGSPLAGATFTLYDTEGNAVKEKTTGANGYAEFGPFQEEATYYLKETVAPVGYQVNETVYTVTVSASGSEYVAAITNLNTGDSFANDTLTVVNHPILGSLTVSKTFAIDDDAQFEYPAVTLTVSGPNGYSNTIVLDGEIDEVEKTAWTATLTNLRYGTYAVTEDSASAEVDGFLHEVKITYVGDNNSIDTHGESITADVTNTYTRQENIEYSKASFQVKKVDEYGNPLPGATFALTAADGTTVVTQVTGDDGIATFDNLPMIDKTYSFNDYVDNSKLETVYYQLTETDAPAGYAKDGTIWTVELGETYVKLNEYNADKNWFETVIDWVAGVFKGDTNVLENGVLTVVNTEIKGQITLEKEFSFDEAPANLDDVTVQFHVCGPVTYGADNVVSDLGTVRVVELGAAEDWSTVLTDLELGDYVIREVSASIHGYQHTGVTYTGANAETAVYVHNGVSYTFQVVKVEEGENETAIPVAVTATNTYEKWDAAGFSIHKVDGIGADVADAEFTVYTDAACTEVYKTGVTGIAGYIHFDGFTVDKDQTMVTYYLKETKAPAGYYAVDTVWKVKVWNMGDRYEITVTDLEDNAAAGFNAADGVLTVVNEKIYAELTVSKVFKDVQNAAKYQYLDILVGVTGPNGAYYTLELNTANNWTATLTGLELGTYYVNEKIDSAYITGYNLVNVSYKTDGVTGNTAVFTDNDNAASTVITNDYDLILTDVEVEKAWNDNNSQDGKRPYAVKLELLRNGHSLADGPVTMVVTAENGWKGVFTGLQKYVSGLEISYTVVERGVYLTKEAYEADTLTTVADSGYSVTHSIVDGVYVLTNSYTPGVVTLNVQKDWEDDGDRAGLRPKSIDVTLYADGEIFYIENEAGEKVPYTLTLSKDNEWEVDFVGLDQYKDGKKIVYTAVESETCVDKDGNAVTLESLGYKLTKFELDGDAYIFTLVNERVNEFINVPVTKVWNDADNQDGIRPYGVEVTLYANNIMCTIGGKPVTLILDASNNWSGSFEGLYKHYEGSEILYTVKESGYVAESGAAVTEGTVDGYHVVISGNASGFTVTNNHSPEQISIDVFKIWDDNNDQDGMRPDSITVNLLADGVLKETVQLKATEDWQYTFSALPKFADGKEIEYTVEEVKVDGYEASYDGFIITNTHEIEKVDVSGTKTWEDNNNQDGIRPTSIMINLLANGSEIAEVEVKADADGKWSYTFADLDKYADGVEITYTVTEDSVNGYTTSIDGYNITNTHVPETVSVEGIKVWDDANDYDGFRPESVTVRLLADGKEVAHAVVKAESNWGYAFTNLPKFTNGNEITYTVTEDAVEHYTTSIEGYTIINTHVPEKTSVSVTKIWDDANDQDGKRPESITVILLANGNKIATQVIKDTDNWAYTFADLDKYSEGKEIVYTIEELAIDGYTTTIDGFQITNTHVPETTGLSVTKIWDDKDNQDGKRPESVIVHLLANGEHMGTQYKVQLTAEKNWTASWSGLPKYAEGDIINYTVYEETGSLPKGYTPSYARDTEGNVVITNKYDPELTAVTIQKVWNDANNQDGIRPETIQVNLLADDVVVQSATVEAANHWKHTFADLPMYDNGNAIVYTVEEVNVPEGYSSTIRMDGYTGIIEIVNTHVPATTSVNVSKIWDDGDNQDGKRTDIIVALYRNGEDTGKTVTLNAENGWKGVFTDLPVHHGIGVDNHYTVEETNLPAGYTSAITGDAATGYVITNSYTPETTSVEGIKAWDDNNNQDGIRPASITVKLLANGEEIRTAEASAETGWKYSFKNLPVYKNGVMITYTLQEIQVAGYTTKINGYNITNSHIPETTSVTVNKVWKDNDDQDGIRPESIQVNLLADGVVVQSATVEAAKNWQYTFTNLPANANGKEILYTVEEVDVHADYTAAVDGLTITNSHEPEKTQIHVTKIWDDNNNQDGKRPAAVVIKLYANGTLVETAAMEAAKDWRYTFENLDVYANGTKITYSVIEEQATHYEEPGYRWIDGNNLEITNTHKIEKTNVSGSKTWVDGDNQDGIRPASITVNLLADGVKVDSVVVTETENWKYSFENLDVYKSGKEILYTVTEDAVEGYTAEINGFDITNTHQPELIDIPVTKIWDDDNNRDGKRPESITVNLLANNEKVDSKVISVDENGEWSWIFEDLPKFAKGEEIVYTVTEDEVLDYTAAIVDFVITNTHKPAVTDIEITKIWDDEDNNDGKRPDSIKVQLYTVSVDADDQEVLTPVGDVVTITPNENGEWTYTYEDLFLFEDGKELVYKVLEVEDGVYKPSYTNSGLNVQITNSYITEKTSVSVNKVWDDEDDQDGIRPEEVTVHLKAGDAVYATVILNAENNWTHTWSDLYVYSAGKKIDWIVVEEKVEGYEAAYTWSGMACTVTNTHEPEVIEARVTKVWQDNNDRSNLRPYSIDVQLYKNGEAYGEPYNLRENNNWTWEIILPVYEDGEKIEWTVKEVKVPSGYTVSYNQESLTVINRIKTTGETPKTGDDSHIQMWTVTMATSAMAMLVLMLVNRKKRGAFEV